MPELDGPGPGIGHGVSISAASLKAAVKGHFKAIIRPSEGSDGHFENYNSQDGRRWALAPMGDAIWEMLLM